MADPITLTFDERNFQMHLYGVDISISWVFLAQLLTMWRDSGLPEMARHLFRQVIGSGESLIYTILIICMSVSVAVILWRRSQVTRNEPPPLRRVLVSSATREVTSISMSTSHGTRSVTSYVSEDHEWRINIREGNANPGA